MVIELLSLHAVCSSNSWNPPGHRKIRWRRSFFGGNGDSANTFPAGAVVDLGG